MKLCCRLGQLGLMAICLSSCARGRPTSSSPLASDAGVAIDTDVMAYLSMARSLHHEANLKEDGDVPGAIAALDRLIHARVPHPTATVPEVEDVLADTFARVAELHVRQGELTEASASVTLGLTHASGPTYFRGHLLEVGGLVEEARAASLRDAGQAVQASAAKARAIDLFRQATVVQERVVNESLGGDSNPPGVTP